MPGTDSWTRRCLEEQLAEYSQASLGMRVDPSSYEQANDCTVAHDTTVQVKFS